MATNNFINNLFGYVFFSAENGFAERFINTCTAEGIPLWDMRKFGEKITAKTSIAGYKSIRSPAKKSSMRVKIIKKSGLPFFINRHIRRTGLIIGLALMLAALIILSGRVWIIEVSGNEILSSEEIISAFEESGLDIGTKTGELNLAQIENRAKLKLKDASWAAISIDGCVAQINVRETAGTPELETHSGTSNIIARKDGQIEILEAYRGSAAIALGQTVTKGELLISGVTESKTQLNLFTDADGYVAASTHIKVETEFSDTVTEYLPTTKKVWSFYFLGTEIFPPRKSEGICYENRSRLEIGGKVLPFGVNYRLYTVCEPQEKTISKAEAELMAINKYSLESYSRTLHAQIISQDVTLNENDGKITISGDYFCYESIGEKVPFEIEEIETPLTE